MIELEIRAHLNANLKEKIIARGAELIKDNILQTDEYFKASPQQTCVIRLRTSNNKHILAFKGESISNSGDIAWPEWENEIDNYEDLKKLLIGCGFNNFVNIRKSRDTYKLGEYEINIDSIEGLGKFIEVELLITNDKLIETGKKQIVDFLQSLGIKEKDIVNKGYVPLCVEAGIV